MCNCGRWQNDANTTPEQRAARVAERTALVESERQLAEQRLHAEAEAGTYAASVAAAVAVSRSA